MTKPPTRTELLEQAVLSAYAGTEACASVIEFHRAVGKKAGLVSGNADKWCRKLNLLPKVTKK